MGLVSQESAYLCDAEQDTDFASSGWLCPPLVTHGAIVDIPQDPPDWLELEEHLVVQGNREGETNTSSFSPYAHPHLRHREPQRRTWKIHTVHKPKNDPTSTVDGRVVSLVFTR